MPFRSLVLGLSLAIPSLLYSQDAAQTAKPIKPTDGVIQLFNGRNLEGLSTWIRDTQTRDPRKVFTVNNGQLLISGNGFGYIRTRADYTDYHLVVEFRWGKRTWGSRKDRSRDSGVLLHAVGPDGSGGGTWMASIESQIIEGGCGDFIVVGGKTAGGKVIPVRLTCETEKDRDGEAVWKKGGKRRTFSSGRINWFGRDPDWKDVLGFRGRRDVESPLGKWTRMEVTCRGARIQIRINGVLVNEGFNAYPRAGKILIQTEMAEMHVRRWEVWPLDKIPKLGPVKQD